MATIGTNVHIGPFTYIEQDVVIGDNCYIANNVSILNGTKIGNNCSIFQGAVVGAVPQDLKYKGENTTVEIGNNVTIREFCTINRGTSASNSTRVKDNCLLMAYVHIAHDCIINENCILANNVTLAGHINIENHARLGGMVAVHQFVHIGEHSMIGGGTLVRKDVPPYVMAAREPMSYAGINTVGLKRAGFSQSEIHHIEDIYRLIFTRGLSVQKASKIVEEEIMPSLHRNKILEFIANANRGIMRGYKGMYTKKMNPSLDNGYHA
jgi:UDP-N-acetylglucosamine acyltransferase